MHQLRDRPVDIHKSITVINSEYGRDRNRIMPLQPLLSVQERDIIPTPENRMVKIYRDRINKNIAQIKTSTLSRAGKKDKGENSSYGGISINNANSSNGSGTNVNGVVHSSETGSLVKFAPFKLPEQYLQYHQYTGAELSSELLINRYDVLCEDIEWIQYELRIDSSHFNYDSTMNNFQKLMSVFERETYKIIGRDTVLDPSHDFPLELAQQHALQQCQLQGSFVTSVYDYWLSKRLQYGKALIRHFQAPTSWDDSSPNNAFRPRGRERRISHRNPHRNDPATYDKMRLLKRDLERVIGIMDTLLYREMIKTDFVLLNVEIFDEQLGQTNWARSIRAIHRTPTVTNSDTSIDSIITQSQKDPRTISLLIGQIPRAEVRESIFSKQRIPSSKQSQKRTQSSSHSKISKTSSHKIQPHVYTSRNAPSFPSLAASKPSLDREEWGDDVPDDFSSSEDDFSEDGRDCEAFFTQIESFLTEKQHLNNSIVSMNHTETSPEHSSEIDIEMNYPPLSTEKSPTSSGICTVRNILASPPPLSRSNSFSHQSLSSTSVGYNHGSGALEPNPNPMSRNVPSYTPAMMKIHSFCGSIQRCGSPLYNTGQLSETGKTNSEEFKFLDDKDTKNVSTNSYRHYFGHVRPRIGRCGQIWLDRTFSPVSIFGHSQHPT